MLRFLPLLLLLLCATAFSGGADPVPALAKKFKSGVEQYWAPVGPRLYAHVWETSNLDYREMLAWLEAHGETEKLAIAQPRHDNWQDETLPGNAVFACNYRSPVFDDFPVVNVSHAAAVIYCDWLTLMYANNPKRKYARVKFHLPTETEWITAARAGDTLATFPWQGPHLRSVKEGWAANFKRVDQSKIVGIEDNRLRVILNEDNTMREPYDHTRITAKVNSFAPNAYGIYNLSGNVAEMLATPGRTKGGSWETTGYYLRIDAEDPYAGWTTPRPGIGFRVFVEVVEE